MKTLPIAFFALPVLFSACGADRIEENHETISVAEDLYREEAKVRKRAARHIAGD